MSAPSPPLGRIQPGAHSGKRKTGPCMDIEDGKRKTCFCNPLFDMPTPHVPNKAQNGNQGSIQAFLFSRRVQVTGLIGAFLITNFSIAGLRTQNSEQPILMGEKPVLISPIGRQNSAHIDLG